ncbi:tetratricopeptide repeat protein [bacterium]|nr:tetratricopeptide repeat protein [candidate division CSSED10-310 bacterium]
MTPWNLAWLTKKKDSLIPSSADKELQKQLRDLDKKRRQFHQTENSSAEAQTLDEIGLLLFRNGFFESARDQWKESLRIFQETNNRRAMAELYSNIGTAHRHEGNLREASRFYQKSLLIDREFNPGETVLTSLHNLGSVWLELCEYDHAMEYFGEALEIARDQNLPEWEADTLYRLGFTYRQIYRHIDAFHFFDDGLKSAEKLKNLMLMTMNILGLGSLYEDVGEYQQALACYSDAVSGAQSLDNPTLFAETLTRLASLRLHIGCLDTAREIARSAHDLIGPDEPSSVRIELDLLRSEIYYTRGMKEKSVALIEHILPISQTLPNRNGYVKAKIQQAIMELDRHRFRSALEIIESLDKYSDIRYHGSTEIEKLLVLGRIFRGLQQADDAYAAREHAVAKAEETRIPKYVWTAHHSLGRIFDDQQRFQLAKNEYERAEDVVYRTAIGLEPTLRKAFLEHRERQQLYQDYILLLMKLGHKEQALRILKRVGSDGLNRKLGGFLEE